jgi:hypothetical protein
MSEHSTYRGLWVTLASTGAGVLAFAALPRGVAPYIVPPCFLVALCGLAVFYWDFARSLRR